MTVGDVYDESTCACHDDSFCRST
ncbi:hypothetical protein DTL36_04285 [Bremerella cremea]|nr:hypothetical protein DTL36_04285 [Bremerella cremea]